MWTARGQFWKINFIWLHSMRISWLVYELFDQPSYTKCFKKFNINWDINIWVTILSWQMKLNILNVEQIRFIHQNLNMDVMNDFTNFYNFFQYAHHLCHSTCQVCRPASFVLHRWSSSLNFLCYVQICIAVNHF